MPSVQYAHGTAFGTYYVNCEIIKSESARYLIRFYDDVCEEHVERWVDRESLQFPKFSEYGTL